MAGRPPSPPGHEASASAEASVDKSADKVTGKSTVAYQFVSPEYFSVLGIDLVRGRGFAQNERNASAAVAVVSESVARQLWPGLDAVGQTLRLEPPPPALSAVEGNSEPRELDDPPLLSRTVEVVGIVRDVAGFRFGGARLTGTGVYMPKRSAPCSWRRLRRSRSGRPCVSSIRSPTP
jgi:hypothetical protein